jgi:hypothetical protein
MSDIASMRELSAELERRLGPAWARIVAWLRDSNQLDEVEKRLRDGNYDAVVQGITDAAQAFAANANDANIQAAQKASEWLSEQSDSLVTYDQTNMYAVRAHRDSNVKLIREIADDQRQTIQDVLREGITRGDNPRVIAQDIRYSLGLTRHQRQIVTNFRRDLETGDWQRARARQLIDGRWSRTFDRLARDGGRLDQKSIDRMVSKYSDNWVGYRAEAIARTEGLRAAHRGYDNAIKQAVDNGAVQSDAFERTWNHKKHGQDFRWFHATMNQQKRGLYEPFISGRGNTLMYPCDPDAPPEETIHCTCVVSTRYIPRAQRRTA